MLTSSYCVYWPSSYDLENAYQVFLLYVFFQEVNFLEVFYLWKKCYDSAESSHIVHTQCLLLLTSYVNTVRFLQLI